MVSALRAIAKQAARAAVDAVAPSVWRVMPGSRLVILMYHRVLPRGHVARSYEQAGMVVSPETLRMQVQVLRKHFELVHLEDWVRRAREGKELPRLACALTFDDGWRDNHEFAFPILKETGAPATIYLVSDLVGGAYGFWPTRIARALEQAKARGHNDVADLLRRETGVEVTNPDDTIASLKARHDDARLQDVAAALEGLVGSEARPDLMSWDQVAEMQTSGLVRFGSHTRTHTRLVEGLQATTAEREILGSAIDLEQRLGSPVEGFCYPNGDHSPAAVKLARIRYTHAVTTRHGWNTPTSDLALLNRVGVHDDVSDTPAKFTARIAMGL